MEAILKPEGIRLEEAMRYSGIPPQGYAQFEGYYQNVLTQALDQIRCRYVFQVSPVQADEENKVIYLPQWNLKLEGDLAWTMLSECQYCVAVMATLSAGYDRWISILQKTDMEKALAADSIGSMLMETLLDQLEAEISARWPGYYRTDRFSCGYGDLDLSLQKQIAALLKSFSIGISVLDSSLLAPCKSVSAFWGLSEYVQPSRILGCSICAFQNECSRRKQGMVCARTFGRRKKSKVRSETNNENHSE